MPSSDIAEEVVEDVRGGATQDRRRFFFLADVDHLKMDKIKESMEKTILLDAKGNPRTGGGGGGAAPAATAKAGCWRRRGRGQRREGGERRRQRSRGQKRQESGRGRQRSPGLI